MTLPSPDKLAIPEAAVEEYQTLREANIARQAAWCPEQLPDLSFRGNELAGETGEVCNVIKKLERERLGWRGSRDTVEHLAEELADVVICADLCAISAGIDLNQAVGAKFNATSEKVGLPHRLVSLPHMPDYAESAPTHRHRKRGSEYVLIGYGRMQAQKWVTHAGRGVGLPADSVDMHEVAIYRSIDDGSLWVRPREEFEDGRFEALVPAEQNAGVSTPPMPADNGGVLRKIIDDAVIETAARSPGRRGPYVFDEAELQANATSRTTPSPIEDAAEPSEIALDPEALRLAIEASYGGAKTPDYVIVIRTYLHAIAGRRVLAGRAPTPPVNSGDKK